MNTNYNSISKKGEVNFVFLRFFCICAMHKIYLRIQDQTIFCLCENTSIQIHSLHIKEKSVGILAYLRIHQSKVTHCTLKRSQLAYIPNIIQLTFKTDELKIKKFQSQMNYLNLFLLVLFFLVPAASCIAHELFVSLSPLCKQIYTETESRRVVTHCL